MKTNIFLIVLVSCLTFLAMIFVMIFTVFHTPVSLWSSLIDSGNVVIIDAMSEQDKTKEVLWLKDLWSSQASLYEMIITTLIGLNALTAILAFVYMGGKAKEEAEKTVEKFVESDAFTSYWKEKYQEFAPDLEDYALKVEDTVDSVDTLKQEISDLQHQIRIISTNISERDCSEEKLSSSVLKKGI